MTPKPISSSNCLTSLRTVDIESVRECIRDVCLVQNPTEQFILFKRVGQVVRLEKKESDQLCLYVVFTHWY